MNLRLAVRRVLGQGLRRALYAVSGRPAEQMRVLLYHSIDNSRSTLSVSGTQLRAHLGLLKSEGWQALSVAEYVERHGEPARSQRECLLTFDDGYANFYDVAAPILLEFGFRATVFVATDFIGDFPGWFERDRTAITQFPSNFHFSSAEMRSVDSMMHAAARQRLRSKAQIRKLSNAGFDFQSHGAGHHFLPSLSADELERDLGRSKRVLAEEFDSQGTMPCYPYGAYNERVAEAAQRLGFHTAVLAEYVGLGEDRFTLGRVPVSAEMGEFQLRFAMSRALAQYTQWMGRRQARGYMNPGTEPS